MTNLRNAVIAGDYDRAWALYQAIRQPDAEAHHLGGRAALGRGDTYRALRAMQAAMEAGPTGRTLGQARLALGELQRCTGNLSDAAETLEAFLAEMPLYIDLGPLWQASALRNLGLTYRQLGRLHDAQRALEAAAEECRRESLQDLLRMALQNLAWVCILRAEYQGAEAALDESEGLCEGSEAHWHQTANRAFLEAETGWRDSTTAACQRIIAPDSGAPADVVAQAYWLLGRAALLQGSLDVARAMAEAAVDAAMHWPADGRVMIDATRLREQVLGKIAELTAGA